MASNLCRAEWDRLAPLAGVDAGRFSEVTAGLEVTSGFQTLTSLARTQPWILASILLTVVAMKMLVGRINLKGLHNNYIIGTYVDDGMSSTTATRGLTEAAQSTHAFPRWSVSDDMLPDIDSCPSAYVNARVLKPQGFGLGSDPNNHSVIVRVDMGADRLLFVRNCEDDEERPLLDDSVTLALLDCAFLKVGHHGSDASTKQPLVDAVTPVIRGVSVAAPGVSTSSTYMHPRDGRAEPTPRSVRAAAGREHGLSSGRLRCLGNRQPESCGVRNSRERRSALPQCRKRHSASHHPLDQ